MLSTHVPDLAALELLLGVAREGSLNALGLYGATASVGAAAAGLATPVALHARRRCPDKPPAARIPTPA
ncbi:hypothetical protein [Streptomyces sp. 900105755]